MGWGAAQELGLGLSRQETQERVGQEWLQEQGPGCGYLGRLQGRAGPSQGLWAHTPL